MKKFALIAFAVPFVLSGCGAHWVHMDTDTSHTARYAPEVNWVSLAEGRATAARERKPLLVDFATPENCERCNVLQKNVYGNGDIAARVNRDFVPVWVNLNLDLTAEEQTLGMKYEFGSDCLMIFLTPDGDIIVDAEGKEMVYADEMEPDVFSGYLDAVLKKYQP